MSDERLSYLFLRKDTYMALDYQTCCTEVQ